MILEQLYQDANRIVVTAHRGFCSRYPENTLLAFEKAAEIGSDLIEFDIRGTRERLPVILHDATVDRTSNGAGSVGDFSLEELKELDFSKIATITNAGDLPEGSCKSPKGSCKSPKGSYKSPKGSQKTEIPTFREALEAIPESVGLNIQIKETDSPLLDEVCLLFDSHNLCQRAYLTMSTFEDAEKVRKINRRIEICILERKKALDEDMLKQMKAFGCRYLQPHRRDVTPALCSRIREMGFYANMFHSNTDEDNRRFISWGMQGIMTDAPDVLLQTIQTLSK